MNRKIWGILIGVLLLIGVFVIYLGFFSTQKEGDIWTFRPSKKTSLSYEDMKKEKEREAIANKDIYNNALKTQDNNLCKDISENDEKRRCYDMIGASIALKEKKKDKCDTLSTRSMIERCQDNVVFALAEESGEKVSCAIIIDENLRVQCESMIDAKNLAIRTASGTIDTAFCETLEGETGDQCRAQIRRSDDRINYKDALSSKTLDSCDSIDDGTLRSQCRDAIIFDMAIGQSDIELCASISSQPRAEYCQKSLSARKDRILYQSLIKESDIHGCESLLSETLKRQCHDVILIAQVRSNQDASNCENLYNTGLVSSCQGLIRP